jgi:hypothetical protein
MEGDESGREPSFKVQDRRRFSATGEAREDVEERPAPSADAPAATASDAIGGESAAEPSAAPEITFASFVFSLSTQALVHLGEIPDPGDGSTHVNLEAARQIIDIVAILKEKTVGNLDAAENALLENALYDLRMRYVERARGQ